MTPNTIQRGTSSLRDGIAWALRLQSGVRVDLRWGRVLLMSDRAGLCRLSEMVASLVAGAGSRIGTAQSPVLTSFGWLPRESGASGGMADAHGSGPCVRKDVEVQLLSRAPKVPLTRGNSRRKWTNSGGANPLRTVSCGSESRVTRGFASGPCRDWASFGGPCPTSAPRDLDCQMGADWVSSGGGDVQSEVPCPSFAPRAPKMYKPSPPISTSLEPPGVQAANGTPPHTGVSEPRSDPRVTLVRSDSAVQMGCTPARPHSRCHLTNPPVSVAMKKSPVVTGCRSPVVAKLNSRSSFVVSLGPSRACVMTVAVPTSHTITTQSSPLKNARERMDIISAYQPVGTYLGAAEMCGTTQDGVASDRRPRVRGGQAGRGAASPQQ